MKKKHWYDYLWIWTIIYFALGFFNARAPWLDSATTVLSICAMILCVMRCFEQWIAWTIVNGLSICLWSKLCFEQGNSLATLLMWVVFFICGLVFARQWLAEVKK